jgi:hypothetical protein
VTPYSSRRRTAWPAALALALVPALALGLTACGGSSDPKSTDDPTETATVSQAPTPTPTPTSTPTAEPLSPFEDRAPVRAARRWAELQARAVNAHDKALGALAPVTTDQGMQIMRAALTRDLDHRWVWPGPQPFTPVNVRVRAGTATLNTCLLTRGWSLDEATHQPVAARKVGPIVITMKKQAGRWLFDSAYVGTADCDGVTVKEVRW